MVDSGTLATTSQALLAIGAGATATQQLLENTNYWILMAEADMEVEAGNNIGLVANHADIPAATKQWLALVASHRAAFYAINHNQNAWGLATTQSKLNVIDTIWQDFNLRIRKADVIADLGL